MVTEQVSYKERRESSWHLERGFGRSNVMLEGVAARVGLTSEHTFLVAFTLIDTVPSFREASEDVRAQLFAHMLVAVERRLSQ
jgi:hypothetical protein